MNSFCIEENIYEIEKMTSNIHKVEDEWNKFLKGKPVNKEVIPREISDSWERSRSFGIDPFMNEKFLIRSNSLKNKDIFVDDHNNIINNHINTIVELESLALKNGFVIQFYDKTATGRIVSADLDFGKITKLDKENLLLLNASEKMIGTNAIDLALIEGKPMQVMYKQHYNYNLSKTCCFATPIICDEDIIGVVNITYYDLKKAKDMAVLSFLLSNFYKLANSVRKSNNFISYYQEEFSQLIENMPQGLAYVDNKNRIKYYNKKIVDILKITEGKDLQKEISKYFSGVDFTKEYNNEEIILSVKDRKKSCSISSKNIQNKFNNDMDKLIILNEVKKKNISNISYRDIYKFNDIIGEDEDIRLAKILASQVAETAVPVLIVGESGTGKELFAQAIHSSSPRKNRPFVAVNCGSIPKNLVESELFGYEPGAFTGALKDGKKGIIEAANSGTLFLDEIESMPMYVQIKLLRVLSTNKITKIGGTKEIPIDIRIISATKKDLLKEADDDRFREDLYYRISMFTIELPPLRERKDDIQILAEFFVRKFSSKYNVKIIVEPSFYNVLSYYFWRGNVRELENVIERGIILAINDNLKLDIKHLPTKVVKAYTYKHTKEKIIEHKNDKEINENLLKIAEEVVIETILKETNCSLSKTAKRLGVSRQTLYNKIYNSEKLSDVKKSYNL